MIPAIHSTSLARTLVAAPLVALVIVTPTAAVAAEPGVLISSTAGTPPVTVLDVRAAVAAAPDNARATAFANPTNVLNVASGIYVNRALAQQARQLGLEAEPEVAAAMRAAADRALAEIHIRRATGALPSGAALDRLIEVEYQARLDRMRVPERVAVSEIFIDANACDAEQTATRVLALARQPGADFAELARTYSQDRATAARGGDLGRRARHQLRPELAEAAFALAQPGDLTAVLRSPSGFYILRLNEKLPEAARPLAEVRDTLRGEVLAREGRRRYEALTQPLLGAQVIHTDRIEALAAEFAAAAPATVPATVPKAATAPTAPQAPTAAKPH